MRFSKLSEDKCDLIFRALFCSIFLGLGMEHIFSDDLIQHLMPPWVPEKRLVSLFCGAVLMTGGLSILLGYKLKWGATILAVFLIVITVPVHGVGVFNYPPGLADNSKWIWDILQRTNLVKNLCLLGVCFRFFYYKPGKFSLEAYCSWKNSQ